MLGVGVTGLVVTFHMVTSWKYALIGITHPVMLAGYIIYTVGGVFLARHGWKQALQSDGNGGQASAA